MHGSGIMQYLRGMGPLSAFVLTLASLALVSPALAGAAAVTSGPSVNAPSPNAGTTIDPFLSLSVSDYGVHFKNDVGAVVVDVVDEASALGGTYLLAYAPEDQGKKQVPELGDTARHRDFREPLLFVFLCGAIIRFFTSPTFLAFMTDTLDPKVW
jgi:hypothetical protein